MNNTPVKKMRFASGVILKRLPDPSLARPDTVSYNTSIAAGSGFKRNVRRRLNDSQIFVPDRHDSSGSNSQSSHLNEEFAHFHNDLQFPSLSPPMPFMPFVNVDSNSRTSNQTLCLPILGVSVDVTVDGAVSYTILKQTFRNPSKLDIPEASHIFPLYDGAVVTSFECMVGNRAILRGVVKPKEEARRQFSIAKEKLKVAALLEELTPEIFETSLGLIPADETVDITITYIHELKGVIAGAEGFVLTIPTSIAPRYGGQTNYLSRPQLKNNKLNIWVRVVDNGTIDTTGCHVESGHKVDYQGIEPIAKVVFTGMAELVRSREDFSNSTTRQNKSVWHHRSQPSVLEDDFVLTVRIVPGHQLHSRAVITPANDDSHAALMLNFRPSDLFGNAVPPQAFTGEIIFLLDCSGSMRRFQSNGNPLKIDAMREAMQFVIAGLPASCAFNILTFGSEVRGAWYESQSDQEAGRRFISQIAANMGGTEILLALKAAVETRSSKFSSTQIILVTDGEVEDEPGDPISRFVMRSRQKFGDAVRFFTLGLGGNVSHRVLESIASLGGGYCEVIDVVEKPHWEGRLNRMLHVTMEPASWRVEAGLGPGFTRRSLMAFRFGTDTLEDRTDVPYVQSPCPIPPLHPYSYTSIFFLLDLTHTPVNTLPKEVILQITMPEAGNKIYRVPVEIASIRTRTIHHLATKAALRSLESEIQQEGADFDTVARTNAEYLGCKYSIVSKWTSFVAITQDPDGQNDEKAIKTREIDVYKIGIGELGLEDLVRDDDDDDDKNKSPELQGRNKEPLYHSVSADLGAPTSKSFHQAGKSPFLSHGAGFSNTGHGSSFSYNRNFRESPLDSISAGSWSAKKEYKPHNAYKSEYFPLAEGRLSWQDAVGCQRDEDDTFCLPGLARARLQQHFCAGTSDAAANELRIKFSDPLALVEEQNGDNTMTVEILVDTLMMIVYFRTHLAAEEDTWNLGIKKVENAVLAKLGLDDGTQEQLKPIYSLLQLCLEHVHFEQALKEAWVGRRNTLASDGELVSVAKTCPACKETFNKEDNMKTREMAFKCRSDDCYLPGQHRKEWETWDQFWRHQVESGHWICPE
ncbi:hypothetical protein M426DRAFT_324552 [Hypoxylon sp. CI-4A]|nr:hypothetical protein M426DRAFT_324552 [Hypoxylon sp. CI-4A]